MKRQPVPLMQLFVTDGKLGTFCVEHDARGTVYAMHPVEQSRPTPPTPVQARLRELLLATLRGDAPPFSVPVCLDGTAFQQEVWKTLMRVPRGETVSYRKLAETVGKPQGQRAVASAVASNRLAYLVPCHRVISSDGSLGGFRWGEERKAAWLAEEHAGLKP